MKSQSVPFPPMFAVKDFPIEVYWRDEVLSQIERRRVLSDLIIPGQEPDEDYVLGQLAPDKFLLLDWPGGTGPSVMNQQYCSSHDHNEGHLVHPNLEEILTKGPFIALHYAQDYVGMIWFDPDTGRFFEQVDRGGEFVDTGTETSLDRLVKDIRGNYGTK